METFLKPIAIAATIDTVILLLSIIWAVILWVKGIWPVLWRMGNALSRRKVTIFASYENAQSLMGVLLDSNLFSKKNISVVSKAEDVGAAERTTLFLVHWHDAKAYIDDILVRKQDSCPLIIYAPRDLGLIPENDMKKIDGYRNTAVTNFRGRLLNDVVTSLITTSYEKK